MRLSLPARLCVVQRDEPPATFANHRPIPTRTEMCPAMD